MNRKLAGLTVVLLFGFTACGGGEADEEMPAVDTEETLRAARADSVAQATDSTRRPRCIKQQSSIR